MCDHQDTSDHVYRVDLKDLGPASQQPLVVMHHVLDVLPVQPGLLLVQAPNLLIALACGYHRFVKSLENLINIEMYETHIYE